MHMRNLSILLVFLVMVGCNQSDSDTSQTANEQGNTQDESNTDSNTSSKQESKKTGKVIATVNGNPIYEKDLNGRNLEFVLTEEVIYQVGLKQGVDSDIEDKVRQYEKVLIVDRTKEQILESADPAKAISKEQIQEYYDQNKDKYKYYRINEISFSDLSLGEDIQEKAEKGDTFQDIANSYPDKAITVTDIGFNNAMANKFDNRDVGSISEVIQKPNGTFSILKIVETKDIPLSASKKSIRHILEARNKAKIFDDYAITAAQENNIEVKILQ